MIHCRNMPPVQILARYNFYHIYLFSESPGYQYIKYDDPGCQLRKFSQYAFSRPEPESEFLVKYKMCALQRKECLTSEFRYADHMGRR